MNQAILPQIRAEMTPKAAGENSGLGCSEGPYAGAVEAAGVEEIGDAAVPEGPPKILRRVHLRLTLAASPAPATPAASFRAIAAVGVGDASGNSVVPFGARWSGRIGWSVCRGPWAWARVGGSEWGQTARDPWIDG